MTENISSTNLPQNPDASDLAMCTRHKNRMYFQTEFIPKLVANINDGYLPPVALYMSSEWNLGEDFDMGEGFYFNKLEIKDDLMVVVYNFPEPEVIGEALYGAVLVNKNDNTAKYYTLEAGTDGSWYFCSRSQNNHLCVADIATRDRNVFLSWMDLDQTKRNSL